jgi:hypothetical protein
MIDGSSTERPEAPRDSANTLLFTAAERRGCSPPAACAVARLRGRGYSPGDRAAGLTRRSRCGPRPGGVTQCCRWHPATAVDWKVGAGGVACTTYLTVRGGTVLPTATTRPAASRSAS